MRMCHSPSKTSGVANRGISCIYGTECLVYVALSRVTLLISSRHCFGRGTKCFFVCNIWSSCSFSAVLLFSLCMCVFKNLVRSSAYWREHYKSVLWSTLNKFLVAEFLTTVCSNRGLNLLDGDEAVVDLEMP